MEGPAEVSNPTPRQAKVLAYIWDSRPPKRVDTKVPAAAQPELARVLSREAACSQAWWPSWNPWGPHGGSKKRADSVHAL